MSALNKIALLTAAAVLTACATAQENPHYQHSTKYKGEAPNTSYASNTVPYNPAVGHANTQQAAFGSANTRQVVYQQTPQNTEYTAAEHSAASYEVNIHAQPSYTIVAADCIAQSTQGQQGCTPVSMALQIQSASVSAPYAGNPQTLYATSQTTTAATQPRALSPTEQAMPDSYGTPGYEAMKNAETEWSHETQQAPQWEAVQNGYAQPSTAVPPGVAVPMTEPFASPVPSPSMRQVSSPTAIQSQQSYSVGSHREIQQGDTVYSFARDLCSSIEEIKAINTLDGNFNIRLGDTIRLPASKC